MVAPGARTLILAVQAAVTGNAVESGVGYFSHPLRNANLLQLSVLGSWKQT
jgi:hypothetical protein